MATPCYKVKNPVTGEWTLYCPDDDPRNTLAPTNTASGLNTSGSSAQTTGAATGSTLGNGSNTGTGNTTGSGTTTGAVAVTDDGTLSGKFKAKMETWFGNCWFPWLLLIILLIVTLAVFMYKKSKQKNG